MTDCIHTTARNPTVTLLADHGAACGGRMAESALLDENSIPDYNERLAFGTDQGRWLQQQVSQQGIDASGPKRRTVRPQHVFHSLEETATSSEAPVQQRPEDHSGSGSGSGSQTALGCIVAGVGLSLLMLFVWLIVRMS